MVISISQILRCTNDAVFTKLLAIPMQSRQCLELIESVEIIIKKATAMAATRQALLNQLSKKDENNNPIIINGMYQFESNEAFEIFQKEIQDCISQTFEIPLKNKIKLSGDEIMTPDELDKIKALIEF